jgi:hypothetical protein
MTTTLPTYINSHKEKEEAVKLVQQLLTEERITEAYTLITKVEQFKRGYDAGLVALKQLLSYKETVLTF